MGGLIDTSELFHNKRICKGSCVFEAISHDLCEDFHKKYFLTTEFGARFKRFGRPSLLVWAKRRRVHGQREREPWT